MALHFLWNYVITVIIFFNAYAHCLCSIINNDIAQTECMDLGCSICHIALIESLNYRSFADSIKGVGSKIGVVRPGACEGNE